MANVLTVDDSLMIRKFISFALASEGYNVLEAADGGAWSVQRGWRVSVIHIPKNGL